jgi:hypothetical protein
LLNIEADGLPSLEASHSGEPCSSFKMIICTYYCELELRLMVRA